MAKGLPRRGLRSCSQRGRHTEGSAGPGPHRGPCWVSVRPQQVWRGVGFLEEGTGVGLLPAQGTGKGSAGMGVLSPSLPPQAPTPSLLGCVMADK